MQEESTSAHVAIQIVVPTRAARWGRPVMFMQDLGGFIETDQVPKRSDWLGIEAQHLFQKLHKRVSGRQGESKRYNTFY